MLITRELMDKDSNITHTSRRIIGKKNNRRNSDNILDKKALPRQLAPKTHNKTKVAKLFYQ